jgi:drug/metabolite transporter (DMT)-like permease
MAWQNWLMAGIAGVAGGFGLMLLYRALADGQMSVAAPISAVMGASIPVLVSAVWLGLPGPLTLLGMAMALGAIWLISSGPTSDGGGALGRLRVAQVRLPLLAGVTFGLYFVLIHRASVDAFYWPIIAARISSVVCLVSFAVLGRRPWIPTVGSWGLVALSGLLDTCGNGFYVLAGQMGRLDVAAVLASLYPGITAALAWLVLKERLSPLQLLGVGAAFLAIILITV